MSLRRHRLLRIPTALLAGTLLAAASGPALAALPDAPPPPRADWALGASLGFGGSYFGLGGVGVGALGGLGGSGGPVPGLVCERRLDDHWWLAFGLAGTLSDFGDTAAARGAELRLGARYVLDPSASVRVAPTFALLGGAAGAEQHATYADGTSETSQARSVRAGAEVGLDVEVAVTAGFALRLATTLITVTWTRSSMETGGVASDLDGVTAGLGLRPTLSAVFSL